jgi:hypothetical protein
MARRRATPRKERKRVVKVQYLERPKRVKKDDDACPYSLIGRLVEEHHPDLKDAKIAVAWMLDVKADRDGHLTLGRCKKASDLDREFREFDIVVLLNSKAWKQLEPGQRLALVDHELCHARLQKKDSEPVRDERDRLCYRIAKHDVEEFHAIVKRHGLYLNDIAELVRAAAESPLYAGQVNGQSEE